MPVLDRHERTNHDQVIARYALGARALRSAGHHYLGEGPPEEVFTDPEFPHTRQFLRWIIETGRL